MIEIDGKLRKAIQNAAEDQGSVLQLSRRINKAHTTVRDWISGKTRRCTNEVLGNLLPYLQKHLSDDDYKSYAKQCAMQVDFPTQFGDIRATMNMATGELMFSAEDEEYIKRQNEFRAKSNTGSIESPEAIPLSNVSPAAVPILSIAQAAGYEPALEPLCDYLRENTDETALFFDVKDNYFALRVSGDSMSPDYPDGSIALVAAGEFPQRGDIVVAKLASGQVVIKEYHRKDNIIRLESINPDGKSFEWHCKEQPGYVLWMWPVIEITLRPRDRRWARAKM